MLIGRFLYRGRIARGVVEGKKVRLLSGPYKGKRVLLKDVKVLTPSRPSKIVCVGLNYRDHAEELGMPIPEEPIIFLKPPTSALAHEEEIIYPPQCRRLDYEAELGVVIGRRCRNISPEDAKRYILGYTCFNDVTARDLQQKDGQWTRAKSFDTFAPFGPFILTTDEAPEEFSIKLYLNGKLKQKGTTKNMIFSVHELVSFVSQVMTLLPGDVIATGTPPGVGPMSPGDEVLVEVSSIGKLKNTIIQ
ncbi:MAG: FAA hydrolase family protein [Nitrospirae bacterium]|nr:MAG: FAA hydrolase family protein [Nitrospirota bacterium]